MLRTALRLPLVAGEGWGERNTELRELVTPNASHHSHTFHISGCMLLLFCVRDKRSCGGCASSSPKIQLFKSRRLFQPPLKHTLTHSSPWHTTTTTSPPNTPTLPSPRHHSTPTLNPSPLHIPMMMKANMIRMTIMMIITVPMAMSTICPVLAVSGRERVNA